MLRPSLRLALILVALLLCACPVLSVIKIEFTIAKAYETSTTVLTGKVTKVDAAARTLEVQTVDVARGKAPADPIRIEIVEPAGIIKEIKPDQPVVLFIAEDKSGAAAGVHVADTWLLADLAGGVWKVKGKHEATRKGFPGRTAALVRLVAELKAGKATILNAAEPNVFQGGPKEVANLKVKPTGLLAADVNGDKKPDLIVNTAGGVKLFLAAPAGYEDATEKWGLSGSGTPWVAADANGDGKLDLMIGSILWLNGGEKFRAVKALDADTEYLAVTLADVTGVSGKRSDVVALFKSGVLGVAQHIGAGDNWDNWVVPPFKTLWKPSEGPALKAFLGDFGDNGKLHALVIREDGITRYALDEDGGPPADFLRLTGEGLAAAHKRLAAGMKNVSAAMLDIDGNGRPDIFLSADGGGMALVNRGFGAFLSNPDAGDKVVSRGRYRVPFSLSPALPMASADLHADGFDELLIATEDGRVYELDNPAYKLQP